MEITPKNNPIPIDSYVHNVQERQQAGEVRGRAAGQEPKGDTVSISDTAQRVRQAMEQLKDIADVREDKVAQIKARIEAGTYEIKPDEIADKMLKDGLLSDI